MTKHHITTPVKPHITLHQVQVHPQDRIGLEKKCDVIYEIPCFSCKKTYIRETGRTFGTQKKEHQAEYKKETPGLCTRATKHKAEQENLKSAISDHCKREKHIMDCEETMIIRSKNNRYHCWIKETMEIRKHAHKTIKRDKGAYMLSHTWDALLNKTTGQQGASI